MRADRDAVVAFDALGVKSLVNRRFGALSQGSAKAVFAGPDCFCLRTMQRHAAPGCWTSRLWHWTSIAGGAREADWAELAVWLVLYLRIRPKPIAAGPEMSRRYEPRSSGRCGFPA